VLLKSLSLVNFRNHLRAKFDFSSGPNLIIGPNAAGKTNLLEAVYLLATGESFRASRNRQMINWGKDLAFVEANVGQNQLKLTLEEKDGRTKKEFWVDKVKKSRRDFLEYFLAVIFRAEEIRVISGSPSRRRAFVNQIISPLDWEYRRAVLIYEKALASRNRVLAKIAEGKAAKQELYFWNQALAKNGEIIRQKRAEFFDFVNHFLVNSPFSCFYQPNLVSLARLEEELTRDLQFGSTGCGPHRDDFSILSSEFEAKDKNLAFWGSRGQHRLAILTLKLAQLSFAENKKGRKPVLLLDDIFSELDEKNRALIGSIWDGYQTIITSTEKIDLSRPAKVIFL